MDLADLGSPLRYRFLFLLTSEPSRDPLPCHPHLAKAPGTDLAGRGPTLPFLPIRRPGIDLPPCCPHLVRALVVDLEGRGSSLHYRLPFPWSSVG